MKTYYLIFILNLLSFFQCFSSEKKTSCLPNELKQELMYVERHRLRFSRVQKELKCAFSEKKYRKILRPAVKNGKIKIITQLFDNYPWLINYCNVCGKTPLMEALDNQTSFDIIMRYKPNLEVKEKQREYTVLMYAVLRSDYDKVKALVDDGANVYATNRENQNAADIAYERIMQPDVTHAQDIYDFLHQKMHAK